MAKKRRKAPSKPQEGREGSDPTPDTPGESKGKEGGKAGEESPKESPSPGELVVPAHGGGMIRHGSQPGNTPGSGRPPSKVKAALRKSFDERITILEDIADDTDAELRERLKAIDMMGKYSDLDMNIDVDLIERLGSVVAQEIDDAGAMARIKERWVELVAARIALGG